LQINEERKPKRKLDKKVIGIAATAVNDEVLVLDESLVKDKKDL